MWRLRNLKGTLSNGVKQAERQRHAEHPVALVIKKNELTLHLSTGFLSIFFSTRTSKSQVLAALLTWPRTFTILNKYSGTPAKLPVCTPLVYLLSICKAVIHDCMYKALLRISRNHIATLISWASIVLFFRRLERITNLSWNLSLIWSHASFDLGMKT